MARDDEACQIEAQSTLHRGIERSRRVMVRYRARLLLLRSAMDRQPVPSLAAVLRSQREQR